MNRETKVITVDDIMMMTDGGRTIFEEELGSIPKNAICSPLRNDSKPSMKLFKADNGVWIFKDMSTDETGNAISFIMKRYNLTFKEAIDKIVKGNNLKPIERTVVKEAKKEKFIVEFNTIPFNKEAHKYWNKFCLSEDFLKTGNIFQVSKVAINKTILKLPKDAIRFVYYAPDIKESKFLTIGGESTEQDKWKSYNIRNDYIWYYYEYKEPVKDLFVVKSVKDRMVIKLLGYEGVALQNESATTFLKSNVTKIQKICDRPIICMGSDDQGFQTSVAITKATGFRWFNTKKYMLKFGINDPASFCQEFSLTELDKQIKLDMKKWEK